MSVGREGQPADPGDRDDAQRDVGGHRRIVTAGRTLREHTARGTIINGLFQVALASLTFAKGFIVAAFLSRSEYGIWGIILVGLASLSWLKGSSVSQKYVQQSAGDQEQAFQTAFTMELILTMLLVLLMVLALPVLAVIYGQWRIVPPGLVIAVVVVPLALLQSPQWVFYRRMDFFRQRVLSAADPVVGFIFTVGLAIAGAGYWSLVLGALAGTIAGAAITLRACPYRIKLRLDRANARDYFSFSWPVAIAGGTALVIAQGSLIITNTVLGLAAVGAVALASQIVQYTDGVDGIITGTLYPAICAVQDRTELLFESFVKSNRLAMIWGVPFGIGVALFAQDIVRFVIGEHWRSAVGLIAIFGAVSASHQIGFNWTAFYNARGNTRPMAVVNTFSMTAFIASAIPLTIVDGLEGMGIAIAILTATGLAGRTFYLTRLFPDFRMFKHMLRAIAPTIPAVICTLAVRLADGASHRSLAAVVELAVYVLVTIAATWVFERELLREAVGYLRLRRPPARPDVAVA